MIIETTMTTINKVVNKSSATTTIIKRKEVLATIIIITILHLNQFTTTDVLSDQCQVAAVATSSTIEINKVTVAEVIILVQPLFMIDMLVGIILELMVVEDKIIIVIIEWQ